MTPDDFAAILAGADYDNIPDCCDTCLCELPHRPAVNLAPLLLDLWRAAAAVRATVKMVPPGAGRMGFLVAPGQGRAFELAAADLVAALAALEEAT